MQKLYFFIAFILTFQFLSAQSGFVPNAGQANGANVSFTYSAGQLSYEETIGNSASFNAGMQQPFEITELTGTTESNWDIMIDVFPNPVNHQLNIVLPDLRSEDIVLQLLDINGKVIVRNPVQTLETQLDVDNLVSGAYLLRITNQQLQRKSFKIIKK